RSIIADPGRIACYITIIYVFKTDHKDPIIEASMSAGRFGVNHHRFPLLALWLAALACSLAGRAAIASEESPRSFTFQGQLLNASGTAPLTGNASLTLGVYDPNGNCLLYEETQSVNLTASSGLFSVSVGSVKTDLTKRTGNDPGLTMAQVFANTGAF